MAVGWAGDNAVNDQIQDSLNDEIARAVPRIFGAHLKSLESQGFFLDSY